MNLKMVDFVQILVLIIFLNNDQNFLRSENPFQKSTNDPTQFSQLKQFLIAQVLKTQDFSLRHDHQLFLGYDFELTKLLEKCIEKILLNGTRFAQEVGNRQIGTNVCFPLNYK
jgi:hypothetical protein